MSLDGDGPYHAYLPPQSTTPSIPDKQPHYGYTPWNLTWPQRAIVIAASSVTASVAHTPIMHLYKLSGPLQPIYCQFHQTNPGMDKYKFLPGIMMRINWLDRRDSLLVEIAALGFTLTTLAGVHGKLSWPWDGFAEGVISGLGVTALSHPQTVAHDMTASGTKTSVLSLMKNPSLLTKDLRIAVAGNLLSYTTTFTLYNTFKLDFCRTFHWFTCACWLCAFFGAAAMYPVHKIECDRKILSSLMRGAPPATFRSVIAAYRKNPGITKMWDGFYSTRPFLRSFGLGLALSLHDRLTRSYTEHLHPEETRHWCMNDESIFRRNTFSGVDPFTLPWTRRSPGTSAAQ